MVFDSTTNTTIIKKKQQNFVLIFYLIKFKINREKMNKKISHINSSHILKFSIFYYIS